MYGRGLPEEMSQYSSTDVPGMRIFFSCNAELLTRSVRSSSSSAWAAASASCYRCGNYLNPGECVCDNIILAGYMADVGCKLRDEV